MTAYVQVEWDPYFYGGDYNGVGSFAYIPYNENMTDEDLESAFEKHTGRSKTHIIHYSFDELYDEHGDYLD